MGYSLVSIGRTYHVTFCHSTDAHCACMGLASQQQRAVNLIILLPPYLLRLPPCTPLQFLSLYLYLKLFSLYIKKPFNSSISLLQALQSTPSSSSPSLSLSLSFSQLVSRVICSCFSLSQIRDEPHQNAIKQCVISHTRARKHNPLSLSLSSYHMSKDSFQPIIFTSQLSSWTLSPYHRLHHT